MPVPTPGFSTSNSGSAITSLNIDLPVNTTNTVMVATIAYNAANSTAVTVTTIPTGWTHAVTTGGAAEGYTSTYWKVGEGDVGSPSWGFSQAVTADGEITPFDNASLSSPNPVTVTTTNGTSGTSHTASAVSTAYNDSLVLYIFTCRSASFDGIRFTLPTGCNSIYEGIGANLGQSIGVFTKAVATAGSSGTAISNTISVTNGFPASRTVAIATLAINPSQRPTAPGLIAPNGGESITVGVTYPVTWNPSTSPTVAQNLLTYKVDYSSNGPNGPWNVLTSGTAAGATSYNWNTTGRTPGTNYYIRVRANDGTGDGPNDVSAAAFRLLADVTPGPPTLISPLGITVDRASNQTFSWLFNDPGDVQSERTWEAGTDGVTFGTTSTASTSSASFAVTGGTGILSTRGQKYWRVKTKDNAGTASPYSATGTFFAGDKPAAPNITSPTAGSPPTEATPLITITSGGHTYYRYRFVREGSQVYDSDWIASSATSWRTVYALAEGVAITLYVSVKNSDGLASDEDSETFTPNYVSPDAPTVTATGNSSGGYIQVTISNTGSLLYNDIYRFDDSQSPAEAIKVAKVVAANGSFQDYNVASGVTYYYIARAIGASGGLFTDSEPSEGASITLTKLWMHVVTKESSTSNASGTPVSLTNLESPGQDVPEKRHGREFKFSGRPKPVFIAGDTTMKSLRASCLESDSSKRSQVQAIYDAGNDRDTHICVRDQLGNILFGKFAAYPLSMTKHDAIEVFVVESDYVEEVS